MSDESLPVKTAQDAIDALESVVAGREDFVYWGSRGGWSSGCFNFVPAVGGNPAFADPSEEFVSSCAVGKVVEMWGFPNEWRQQCCNLDAIELAYFINTNSDEFGYSVSSEARAVLRAFQEIQDQRDNTWGQALTRARNMFANL